MAAAYHPGETVRECRDAAAGVIGALDLGSRTLKAAIGQRRGGRVETRLLGKRQLDLGRDVAENGGVISDGKLAETFQALVELRDLSRDHGAGPVLAVATRAVRAARNQRAILGLARDAAISLEIADGVREGQIGYLAATQGAPGKLVSNLGSRSLQLAWTGDAGIEALALDSGYEDAYADFFANTATFTEAETRYRGFLDQGIARLPGDTTQLICSAANTAARYVTGKPKAEVTDRDLPLAELAPCLRALREQTVRDFQSLKRDTGRVRKVLPGLVLLDYLLGRTGHREAFIAEVELPAGLIVEFFLANQTE